MKIFLLALFYGISLSCQSQDLTGIWRGNFRQNSNAANSRLMEILGADDRYKFEVQLDQNGKLFNGVTYSYLTTVFYGKATCKGTVNPATRKVLLEEIKIVEVRMSGMSEACIMTLFLQYSKLDNEEFLEGTYTSMNVKDSSNCGRGTVFLRKVTTSDFYKEPFLEKKEEPKIAEKKPANPVTTPPPVTKPPAKKPVVTTTRPKSNPATTNKSNATKPKTTTTPKNSVTTKPPVTKPPVKQPTIADSKPNVKIDQGDSAKKIEVRPSASTITTPKVLASRENELVKTIVTNAREIVVNIYDNGTVDNDTISVYLDKKLVLSKKRLTEKAISLTLQLDDTNSYHELVMVAENLGEIPPNTSLMIVKAGSKEYEVRITSTEQKNAVVIFKYQKE
jgi:hypothetical protein